MPPVHYRPGAFPPQDCLDWAQLIPLIGPASASVARYDGLLAAFPDPDNLLTLLSLREAVISSRMDGGRATLGEVLEFEAGQKVDSPALRRDVQQTLNYHLALHRAEQMLAELPLCLGVIRAAHRTLLRGTQRTEQAPGELRRGPSRVGRPGASAERDAYVPIDAAELPDGVARWERYIHEAVPDRLIQLAILHAEFEALHPFAEGNGRLGRMLVPLFLWHQGMIRRPVFYISAYLEERRDLYYDGLLAIFRDGDWTTWCRYFLEALRMQAEDNLAKAQEIFDLYDRTTRHFSVITRSPNTVDALTWLFGHPVVRSSDFTTAAGVPKRTAHRLLGTLMEEGILQEIRAANGRRPALLGFPGLLSLAEKDSDIRSLYDT
jgi:Fic family protein